VCSPHIVSSQIVSIATSLLMSGVELALAIVATADLCFK